MESGMMRYTNSFGKSHEFFSVVVDAWDSD